MPRQSTLFDTEETMQRSPWLLSSYTDMHVRTEKKQIPYC